MRLPFAALLPLAFLGGCGLGLKYTSDADPFSDLEGDTGEGGGGSGGLGDPDQAACPTGGRDYAWVATSLAVGAGDEGLDLDGDGSVDNVLAIAASALNPSIDEALAAGAALVVQFWAFDDWCFDDSFYGGLVVATDPDGDPSDNASGETFSGGDALDADGHATLSAEGAVDDSQYDVWIPGAEVEIGGILLVAATPIHIQGVATPTDNAGLIGFGIGADDLRPFAESAGFDPDLVDSLADLDSDGDGTLDALSIGFRFASVSCRIE